MMELRIKNINSFWPHSLYVTSSGPADSRVVFSTTSLATDVLRRVSTTADEHKESLLSA